MVVFFLVFIYLFEVQLSSVVIFIYLPFTSTFLLEMILLNFSFAVSVIEKANPKRGEIPDEIMSGSFCTLLPKAVLSEAVFL